LSPRKRLVFVLCFVAVVAALAMHRWPRPARIDLAEVQQRVEALRQEVEQARAAPDLADAYTPQTPGSIADLATDAAALLRQLPGVENVEVLVACPKPTHRIIHLRDWHWVDRDTLATEWAHDLGRSLPPEEVDLRYEEALLQVELVQRDLLTVLRCLIRHHGLRQVFAEAVTTQGVDHVREQVALLRKTDQGLTRLMKQRAELGGKVEDLDRELAGLMHGHHRRVLEFGVAGRLAIDQAADVLPLEDEQLAAAAHSVRPDGTVRLDPAALEARHDAQVNAALASGSVAVLVLGANHDLSPSVRRLGGGTAEYLRVTTAAVGRFAGKGRTPGRVDPAGAPR
jgi:hypothetical protein